MSSSKAINYGSCFLCGDADHWKVDCRWLDYPCVLGCPDTMAVRWSGQENTKAKGKVVEVEVEVERNKVKNKDKSKGEGKLKLCINDAIKMHIEGNMSDITRLVRKLAF
ncbi:hypothetical protein IFM89_011748 [Coptis chinensis]|uniref:CCHC-type domain-containing protein n=1 Tax=Coptis chinensis TaxID=261450 RepID=A0A835IVQ7_9MAGN|nr:hypothetical protein IFM89_011748 [Coptis chinensis]